MQNKNIIIMDTNCVYSKAGKVISVCNKSEANEVRSDKDKRKNRE